VIVLGFIWSRSPGEFDVRETSAWRLPKRSEKTGARLCDHGHCDSDCRNPAGQTRRLSQQRQVTPPGVYLDNIPNWEFGVLTELRDLARDAAQ
jgi:hypothetical protein